MLEQVDVVVSMVFGPKEIEAVVRGDNGFLSTSCQGKYWIDLTTSSPQLMRALGEEVSRQRRRADRRAGDRIGRCRDSRGHADVH